MSGCGGITGFGIDYTINGSTGTYHDQWHYPQPPTVNPGGGGPSGLGWDGWGNP